MTMVSIGLQQGLFGRRQCLQSRALHIAGIVGQSGRIVAMTTTDADDLLDRRLPEGNGDLAAR